MNININETLFMSMSLLNQSTHKSHYRVCIATPPKILSDGIWGGHKVEAGPSKSSFPLFLLQVILIYATTRALSSPVKKLGLPVLISQMMAGLLIGPMVPILIEYKKMLFPYGSQDTLTSIIALGYVLFLFETGVKMDFSMMFKIGRKGWGISLLGLIIPLLIGFAFQKPVIELLTSRLGSDFDFQARIIFVIHNTTSFAVIASVLSDLKLLNSELGRLVLSCALVGDILSHITVSITSSVVSTEHNMLTLGIKLGSLFAVVIFLLFFYRPAMFWVIEHTPEGKEVKDIYINIIIGILFSLCWFSAYLERGPVVLPFIFGLATPEGPPLGSTLIKRIHLLGTKFLLPIFVTTSAIKVETGGFFMDSGKTLLKIVVFVVLMCYLLKLLACLVSSLFFNMPLKDAFSLALLLNCKGVVEVTMLSTALDRNDIEPRVYSIVVLVMMLSICITHVMVKYLYDPSRKYAGYRERNIFSLNPNSDLKILVCIHKQHHITPITTVLDLCNPTTKDPIIVDALHLIELVGRSSPIFISHKKKKQTVVTLNLHDSYSDNVVLSLKLYEDDKQGATLVNPYTAISPFNLMHEDVCNLALDKLSSIIILPFHRRWSNDGKVEYDDKNIRSLNDMVLDRAPCSVGILVSRVVVHQIGSSSLRLALIFLGGKDDREALCLVNRAARDSTNYLVIYHIVHKNMNNENEEVVENMEAMLDKAMLKNAKQAHFSNSMGNVTYRKIQVEGGSQTVNALRQIVDEHDFIIVGRRHGINSPQTTGLQQWSEFPELGVIGDYLASSDLDCKASLLVVQQQKLSL